MRLRNLLYSLVLSGCYAASPLRFEPNVGQAPPEVRVVGGGDGYNLFLSSGSAVLSLPTGDVRMTLTGAQNSNPSAWGPVTSFTNYYRGSDPKHWQAGVPNYKSITFPQVYHGIDIVYYGSRQRLEYDFVIAPNADPGQIRIRWTGTDSMLLDRDGKLVLQAHGRRLWQHKPVVYQEVNGKRVEIAGYYKLGKGGEVRLLLAAYDHKLPLVIDPVLVYSTYVGGPAVDSANGIAVDRAGAVYITGSTRGGFPTIGGEQFVFGGASDVFVTKFSPTGALVYSTYLGGSNVDSGTGIAVDSAGAAFIAGYTFGGFPLKNAAQQTFAGTPGVNTNAFIAQLDPNGRLVYSTYLGGPNTYGAGIAVDKNGSAYVTGQTTGGFPVLIPEQSTYGGGLNDAFVAKLSATGTLVYATYLGGANSDAGTGIAVDSSGGAYVVGYTTGGFPVFNAEQPVYGGGVFDAFVAKFSPAGGLVYATYLGGSSADLGAGIAVDSAGCVYVTGQTLGGFPVWNAQQPTFGNSGANAFVTKLSPTGQLAYSTYLGGSADANGAAIAVDSVHQAYVTGTAGPGFPVLNPEQPTAGVGSSNVFVTKFTAAGAIAYSTYLGGNIGDGGSGIAVDSTGSAYVAGSSSGAFPVLNAEQPAYGGGLADAFVAKVSASGTPAFYLDVAVSHIGNFTQGQSNAIYTVTVANAVTSGASTSSKVTVTEQLPPDLTLVSMTGSGWNCSANTCSRSDALGRRASYPAIMVKVDVTGTSNSSLVNVVNVFTSNSAIAAIDPTIVMRAPPFGSFDTPAAATSNVNGSVGFTGWALSSPGISVVDIWREPNPGEAKQANGLVYIGAADSIAGARPDVQALYPNYPGAAAAGWGFLMLTNELPGNAGNTGVGNGTYRVHAIAHDVAGSSTDLGIKTIVVDNDDAMTPFGTIDTPAQGGIASGSAFVNFGWALTPGSKRIPADGSTIWVVIDKKQVAHPVYNNYRVDIATLFPGYTNSQGAVGYFIVDTTRLANGLHTISWNVTDDAGVSNGIGSRFFIVQN